MNIYGVELYEQNDRVVTNYKRDGDFEPNSMREWMAAVRDGGVAIDVGSYTGLYALAAAMSGAKVVAYEPNPTAFARLIMNVQANGTTIDCRPQAVSDKRERRKLYMRGGLTSAGRFAPREGDDTVEVQCVTIDAATLPAGKVVAMKIDVEGAELAVLRGAHATITRDRPLVIAEALTDAMRRSLVMHMTGIGYSWEQMDRRNLVFKP